MKTPDTPPPEAVMQADRDAERAEQFGKDFRAEQASNFGCGGEIECCFPMDGNCACFNAVLARHATPAPSDLPRVASEASEIWEATPHADDCSSLIDTGGPWLACDCDRSIRAVDRALSAPSWREGVEEA